MSKVRAVVKRLLWPLTLPLLPVLWLLEPFLRLRLGRVMAERIGHLAANTEVTVRERRLGLRDPEETMVFFASGPVANWPLLTMYRRQITIFVNNAGSSLFSLCEPWLRRTRFFLSMPFDSREFHLWNDSPPILTFTPEEEARGRAGLARMGIGPDDWFVAFFTRDPGYLNTLYPANDYSYHDHRNTTIDNFSAAVKFVAEQGGFAVRLGAALSKPLPESMRGPRVIDYATKHRDDFMDVYLMAKSRFVITSDTGLGHLAVVFGVPAVNTNAICLDWAGFLAEDIFIQKHYVETKTGRRVTTSEMFERGLERVQNGHLYTRGGIELVENTPEEILAATKEMHERLAGTWKGSPEDEELQRAYRARFKPEHYCYGYRSRIGAEYLRRNKDVLIARPT